MDVNWYNVAMLAYEAYAQTTDNKNFRGEEMPKFGELPGKIQEAWIAAVRKACDVYATAATV